MAGLALNRHPVSEKTVGITLRPAAKLNLSLVVFDTRPDGYHDLHTVMGLISLHDELTLQPSPLPGIHLTHSGLATPDGPGNLVWKAAELLARHVGREPNVQIHLHKVIPSGAGLGGGSSDAAACLLGLNHLWQCHLSPQELNALAAQLGSDVPFFLQGPLALCTGRGEIIDPLPALCDRSVLLIIPAIHCSTAVVYRHYHYDPSPCRLSLKKIQTYLKSGDMNALLDMGINTLTDTTMKHYPALDSLRHQIEAMDIGPVRMSGSGASLFVISPSACQLTAWAQRLKTANVGDIHIVRFLAHRELLTEVSHADL